MPLINPTSTSSYIGTATGDIASLVTTVMMTAAKEAQQDLRAVVGEMKQIVESKSALRDMMSAVRDGDVSEPAEKGKSIFADALNASLDSLGGQSELFQLGLQRLMDDIAKAAATMSNVMKKHSDAQDDVIRNIK